MDGEDGRAGRCRDDDDDADRDDDDERMVDVVAAAPDGEDAEPDADPLAACSLVVSSCS